MNQYKMENFNSTGIYTITNIINNKIYVGSASIAFKHRKYRHFHNLKNNKHGNKYLQDAVNKYGIENFKFEILEECFPEFCISIEIFWTNILNTTNKNYGYNICYPKNGSFGIKHRPETIIKLRNKQLGIKPSKEI